MSAAHIPCRMTVEEFIDFELESPDYHEYYNGEIFDMGGGTDLHALLTTGASYELRRALKGSQRTVYNSDLLVMVERTHTRI